MAWGRVVSLKVGVGDPGVAGNAVDVSDLHLEFNVRRSRTFADNHAEFTIYNAAPETRQRFLVTGATVCFGAGYEDEDSQIKPDGNVCPTIFWGYVALASTRKVGTDFVTKLSCKISLGMKEKPTTKVVKTTEKKDASGKVIRAAGSTTKVVSGVIAAATSIYLDMNYAPNTHIATVFSDIADQLALTLIDDSLIKGLTLPNGLKASGSVVGIFKTLKAELEDRGMSMFEENNSAIIFYELGKKPSLVDPRRETVLLTWDSGLLQLEELENEVIKPTAQEVAAWNLREGDKQIILKKIRFGTLLDARIKPNSRVRIETEEVQEGYIVDAVEYTGDNFGGEFNLKAEAAG